MEFNFAKVTNSRLMGTMGLIISWDDKSDRIVQYFLLDAEGLGLADYVSLKNPTKDEANPSPSASNRKYCTILSLLSFQLIIRPIVPISLEFVTFAKLNSIKSHP